MIYKINDRSVRNFLRSWNCQRGEIFKEGEAVAVFTTGIFFSIFLILSNVADLLTYCLFLFLEIWQTSSWVIPKLSQSNVAFRDITWDPVSKQVNN